MLKPPAGHPWNSLLEAHKVFDAIKTALLYTPWTGRLQGFRNTIDLQQLSAYLTREWLTDEHELLMLDVLKSDLLANNCTNHFIEDPAFTTLLEVAYKNQEDYTTSNGYQWIRTRGEELASGQKRYLATIVNQHGTHWTAVVIDFVQHEILYGDSYQNTMDSKLRSILDWWVQEHSDRLFAHHLLPITRQQDDFSCGVLAWDAICCYLLPGPCRPLMDPRHPMIERAKMFLELTKFYRPKDLISDDKNFEPPATSDNSNQSTELLPHIPCKHHAPEAPQGRTKKAHTNSTIRNALEGGKREGLLRYFRKATHKEHEDHLQQMTEYIESRSEEMTLKAQQDKHRHKLMKQKKATERKRLQQAKLKNIEIISGLRSPGGRKQQVCPLIYAPIVCLLHNEQRRRQDMQLREEPSMDQGGSVAELSRPAHALKERLREQNRKPQGRKAFRQSQKTIYHNWFTPFLFKQIENARIVAGGPKWSTSIRKMCL
jgi:hypothetical protein